MSHGKPPPHDLDAEAAVMSAAMLDPLALDIATSMLSPEQFWSEPNQHIFRAICELAHEKSNVDIVTVSAKLRAQAKLALVDVRYIAQVADATPHISHVEDHARVVLETYRMRKVIELGHRIVGEGYGDVGQRGEWIAEKERQLFDLSSETAEDNDEPIGETLRRAFTDLSNRSANPGAMQGATTGLRDLDWYTGGLCPGELWIVAGRPGMGKTALGAHMTQAVATEDAGVQVQSLEMPRDQWALRLPCSHAGVDSLALRRNQLDPDGWSKLTAGVDFVMRLPIFVDDRAGLTIEAIRASVRRRQARLNREGRKLGLLVVDYLQLCDGRGAGKGAIREQQIGHISRNLKTIAKDCAIPVVALAQLSRAVESRPDKRPMLSDLRESGQIEQDADVILFLYRGEYYNDRPDDTSVGVAEINVAKARSGETGMVPVRFKAKYTRFSDLTPDERRDYTDNQERRQTRKAS